MYIIKVTLRSGKIVWFSGFVEQVSITRVKVHVDLTEDRDFATQFRTRQMANDLAVGIGQNDSFAILQTEEV